MKELIIYQFEVACCLFALTLLYFVFWKKETNFQMKRVFILSIPILAFIIPWLDFNINLSREQTLETIQYFTELPTHFIVPDIILDGPEYKAESMSVWQIMFWVWLSGIIAMTIRVSVSYYNIWKIYRNSVKPIGYSYRVVNEPIQSFSFFSFIALNKHHENCKVRDYILAHERAHSQQLHSLDVILFETLKILQWFNPAFWILTNELKLNLEYLADQVASDITNNTQKYQFAIIHHASLSRYQLLKSEFSKSNLKNRIIMMNQQKNNKIGAVKLMLLLPLIGVLFLSFSMKIENLDLRKEVADMVPQLITSINENAETVGTYSVNSLLENKTSNPRTIQRDSDPTSKTQIVENSDTTDNHIKEVFAIVEDMPTPSTGDIDSYYEAIYKDLNYPEEAINNDISGKVFVQFIVQKDGTLREVKAVKGIGYGCDEEAVRVIKNGPLWNAGEQRRIKVDVRMILPIPFGVPLKNRQNDKIRMIKGEVITEQGISIPGASVAMVGTQTGTFSDPDGKFDINVKTSPRDQLELVVSARGFSTIIIAVTKEDNYKITLPNRYKHILPTSYEPLSDSLSTDDNKNPLVILDGKEITYEQMKKMDTNPDVRIDQISVLKDATAIKKYGQKAENGVIIITTKE